LRKREALAELAQGNASTKLYFTPADVNLSIENHEHEKEGSTTSGSWKDVPSRSR